MNLRQRFNISRLAIAFPRSTIAIWIAVCVIGVLAFRTLRVALLPDVTFPVVIVTASPGKAPLDLARDVALPIERRLQTVEGLGESRASVWPNIAVVRLQFRVGQNLERCTERVTSALRDVKLPEGVTTRVIPRNLNETSVATYALSQAGKSPVDLEPLARESIIPAIAAVPGVQEVSVLGGAAVGDTGRTISRFNGNDVLALDVIKRGDANTLEVAQRIDDVVKQLRAKHSNLHLDLARTQADFIREASHSTIEALLIAVALSVVVIYPFLWNWPATAISALAIPTSLLGTVIVMALCGFELDTITLLALALVIGIIIDDAIVDVENIARHLTRADASPKTAALEATDEIGLTVTAATFTIVAVFLPVAFMKGSVGQFFKPFGVTVSAAVIVSLLVARTLSPVLAAKWLRTGAHDSRTGSWWTAIVDWYERMLEWSLRRPKTTLLIAVASLAAGVALIPFVPHGLIPRFDRGEFKVAFRVAPAAMARTLASLKNPLAKPLEVATELEKFVRTFPEVDAVYTRVGTLEGDPTSGVLYVRLAHDRKIHTAAAQDLLRRDIPKIDDVTTSVEDIAFIDLGEHKPIDFAIVGDDSASVDAAAARLVTELEKTPGLVDVASSAADPMGIRAQQFLGARPAVFVTANLGGEMRLGEATRKVLILSKKILPAGVSIKLGGDSANVRTIFTSFGITLGLAVICIFAVLVLLFRNWVDPFIIVLTLPLAVVGAVLALLVARSEFGMISLLGIVFLFGLVNKNAILLVDYINQLRAAGADCGEAIRRAGAVRLRPILMTTLATILGMLPVAIGLGAGAELRSPMAVAIIGGLITSTLLSLLVVPVAYALLRRCTVVAAAAAADDAIK